MTDQRINLGVTRRPVSLYSKQFSGPASGTTRTDELVDVFPGTRLVDALLTVKAAGTGASTRVTIRGKTGSVVIINQVAVTSTSITRMSAVTGAIEFAAKDQIEAFFDGGTFTGAATLHVSIWLWRDSA